MDANLVSTRVVALTTNPSLVIGLTFLGRDWDVVSQADADGLPECDAVVIDLGTTHAGIELLATMATPRPPAIVIGDIPLDIGAGDRLLVRPYTLSELADQVDEVTGVFVDSEPGAESEPVDAFADDISAATENRRSPAVTTGEGEAAVEPPSGGGYGMVRSWATRLSRKEAAAEERSLHAAAQDPVEPSAPSGSDAAADNELFPIEDDLFPVADASAAVHARDELIDLTEGDDPQPEPASVAAPMDEQATASVPGESTSEVIDSPPTIRRRSAPTRRRSTIRRSGGDLGPDAVVRRRLAEVVTAGTELQALVTEVPLLRSIDKLARAIVAEIHTDLQADTVAFWQRTDAGYHAVASIGLTKLESTRPVALDQPMMREVEGSGGGLLIDPIDAAQAAVAGIGGAHTESFMLASIAAGPGRFGLLGVGRHRPLTGRDLDRLLGLAAEASPGVATAQLLRQLAELVITPNAATGQDADQRVAPRSYR